MTRVVVRSLVLALLVAQVALPAYANEAVRTLAPGQRMIAIGDVHGAYDALVAILRQTGLIDEHLDWIGGTTLLVQTGDLVDRGARTRRVLDLMIDLEAKAASAGGEVVVLLGNHEVMNLLGDLRDVTPEILDRFADDRSAMRRSSLCRALVSMRRRQASERGGGDASRSKRRLRQACLEAHPPGMVAFWQAFGTEGSYGRWLRGLKTVLRVDDVLLVHGGISPAWATETPSSINRRVQAEITTFDRAKATLVARGEAVETADLSDLRNTVRALAAQAPRDGVPATGVTGDPTLDPVLGADTWIAFQVDGPLWFRGYAQWSESQGNAALPDILEAQGVGTIAVGHTPQQAHEIGARFQQRVFLLDTGMLRPVYGGAPSALELVDGHYRAVYLGREEVLTPTSVDDSSR